MVAFWSAVLGALIGSGLSLLGVWLTLSKQVERDQTNDSRRLRDARALRLRAAYHALTRAGLAMEDLVPRIGLAAALMTKGEPGARESYFALMKTGMADDVGEAQASLLLELEEDQEILEAFETTRHQYTTAWLSVSLAAAEGKAVPVDDFKAAVDRLSDARSNLAELARLRLSELEQPI